MASALPRKNYARIQVDLGLPNLIEVQLDSFERLKREGLGDLFHEGQEICLCAGGSAGGEGLTRMHVQGRDEGLGSVADILELLSAKDTRARGPVEMLARDGLHSRLLVDGEHDGAFRRLAVEVADHIHLFPEGRIRAVQPDGHPMGMQVGLLEDAMKVAPAKAIYDSPLCRKFPKLIQRRRAPAFCLLCGPLAGQGHKFETRLVGDPPGAPGTGCFQQSVFAFQRSLPAPFGYCLLGNAQDSGDVLGIRALVGHQGDPRPEHVPLRACPLPNERLKLRLLLLGKAHIVGRTSAAHAPLFQGLGNYTSI